MRAADARRAASINSNNSRTRSEEHTSELQSPCNLVCRLLLEKKKMVRHSRSTCMRSNSPARQPNRVPAKPDRQVDRRRSCWQRTKRPSESCLPTFSEEEGTQI